jgi:inositol 1,4,5-triphosphate receptor type 1
LDLDGQEGRLVVNVLLNLAMHDYPQLASGALNLLFRQFSQREELLEGFKKVCFGKSVEGLRFAR